MAHPSAGPTIQLCTGRYFDFTDPTPLTIAEVAYSLSKLCRFTGHCHPFYSVAQHSLLVSALVPQELALWGLLHDAVEAVVGDVSSPLKSLIPDYKAIETRCEAVILEGFGLHGPIPPEVKHADLVALRVEQRDLMPGGWEPWSAVQNIGVPASTMIGPLLPPNQVAIKFIDCFEQLARHGQF